MKEKTTTTIDLLARRHFFFFLVCFTFSLFVVLLLPRRRFSISLGDWLIDDVEIVRQQPTNKPKKETTSPWDSYCFVFLFLFFFPPFRANWVCVTRVCLHYVRTNERTKKKHQTHSLDYSGKGAYIKFQQQPKSCAFFIIRTEILSWSFHSINKQPKIKERKKKKKKTLQNWETKQTPRVNLKKKKD